MELLAILARLVQYAGVALAASAAFRPGRARARTGAILGGLGVIAWLWVQAGVLGDTPAAAFDLAQLWAVASGTGFGRAALVRLALLAGAALAPPRVSGVLAVVAAGSFAWTGHGAADGWVHQSLDVIHLVAAAVWIGALLALGDLAVQNDLALGAELRRFSRFGPWVVAALAVSGLGNTAYLVGIDRLPSLAATPYGRLLILKLGLFAGMLALAGLNRWRLTARADEGDLAAARASLLAESLIGLAVLTVVAWMGTLPPLAEG